MLTLVDDCTRECPAIESILRWVVRVRRVLDRVAAERGLPEAIVLDNGPESAVGRWPPGVKNGVCDWSSFSRASRCRMPLWKASTAGSGMNA